MCDMGTAIGQYKGVVHDQDMISTCTQSRSLSWGNNDKGFGFALSVWFIVVSVTGYVSGVSLILKCLSGGKWLLYTVAFGGLDIGV